MQFFEILSVFFKTFFNDSTVRVTAKRVCGIEHMVSYNTYTRRVLGKFIANENEGGGTLSWWAEIFFKGEVHKVTQYLTQTVRAR